MLPIAPSVFVLLAMAGNALPSDELVAAAKSVKLGATEAAVRAQLGGIGSPGKPAYSRCWLDGCKDAVADSATRMGLIWSRGEGNALSMLYVGFCRRSGQWLAEDVTTYDPGLTMKLIGKGDWKETFRSKADGVCDIPLLDRYLDVANALSLGASPDSVEQATTALGRPDGVTFSACTKIGCLPASEAEASMMAVRWGRVHEGLQAELTLIFCGALADWELSAVHVARKPSSAGAFGTERPATEVYRKPTAGKALVKCQRP
jgi:hypothetical protein